MTMPTKVRAALRAKLEKQIAWEKSQVDFFAKLGDIANEQYYMGRMHALLNLKWEL
jgi:hypothetical protein